MTSVLIVDDERPLRRALRTSLQARDLEVTEVDRGGDAVVAVADRNFDLVVLDLGLPDLDGIEVLRRIRSFSEVPIIVVTARDDRTQKVALLDAGADDYVTKPFDTEELLARMRAAMRRRPVDGPPRDPVIEVDDLRIDLTRRLVTIGGERVGLTRTELGLREALATNPGRLLTHDVLLRKVWGPGYGTESNYLRTYVGQLRKKLGDDAASPRLIATAPGVGYRWLPG